MSFLADLIARLARGVLNLALALSALVFLLSLLLAGGVVFVGMLLSSLVTGRRPGAWVAFSQLRERARRTSAAFSRSPGAWPPGARPPASADVVDVQAREVR